MPNAAQRNPAAISDDLGLAPRADRGTVGIGWIPCGSGLAAWTPPEHSGVSLAFLRTHRVASLMAEHTGGCADSSRCVLPLRVRDRDSRGLLAELGR